MAHIFPHIIPDISKWPISALSNRRREFIEELNEQVVQHLRDKYKGKYEDVLLKTVYLEKQRVKNSPWKVDPSDDNTYWPQLEKEVNAAGSRSDKDDEFEKILKRIINRYNEEIVGGFKVSTFKFARRFLTILFKFVFNPFNSRKQRMFWGKRQDLLSKIHVDGYINECRSLFEKGTVVIVPTHFSNLDSIMLGYALDMVAGMPAFAYGAGLNLYDAEIPAYFMNRLGAYRVDRRKKNPVYLECLTGMASYNLITGVNNIFFPGGTRSRSGAMEEKLKLGLLGSVIDAQRELITNGRNDKIFVVPVVLGYHFVFEAKSLVDQYLQAEGQEKYSRSRENKSGGFSKAFLKKFFTESSEFYLSFGEPMDVLGNAVDESGASLDKQCRPLDLKDYFMLEGEVNENNQRESVYARLLGSKVLESYFRNNLILTSHLVAYVAFELMQHNRRDLDVFGMMKVSSQDYSLDRVQFDSVLSQFVDWLKDEEEAGRLRLHNKLHAAISEILHDGLNFLGAYHTQKVIYIKGEELKTQNIRLLYFYHNRLAGYNFEKIIKTICNKT